MSRPGNIKKDPVPKNAMLPTEWNRGFNFYNAKKAYLFVNGVSPIVIFPSDESL